MDIFIGPRDYGTGIRIVYSILPGSYLHAWKGSIEAKISGGGKS